MVVGTPGRVVDHLSNTKGFSLKGLGHLVLDEADRLLNMDFEQEIDQILKVIPKVGGGSGMTKSLCLQPSRHSSPWPLPFHPPTHPTLRLQERRTQLFSATMTSKVAKLQRACLTSPVKVEVAAKYSTVDTLRQQYIFVPAKHKDAYLAYVLTGGWGPQQ